MGTEIWRLQTPCSLAWGVFGYRMSTHTPPTYFQQPLVSSCLRLFLGQFSLNIVECKPFPRLAIWHSFFPQQYNKKKLLLFWISSYRSVWPICIRWTRILQLRSLRKFKCSGKKSRPNGVNHKRGAEKDSYFIHFNHNHSDVRLCKCDVFNLWSLNNITACVTMLMQSCFVITSLKHQSRKEKTARYKRANQRVYIDSSTCFQTLF